MDELEDLRELDPLATDKILVTDECWEWTGSIHALGYGRIGRRGRVHQAHRWVYELLVGAVPEGLELDHLCRNRACVNPAHLEPVTHGENVARGDMTRPQNVRDQCPRGHPYSGDNLYVHRGHKFCRQCKRDSQKRPAYKDRKNELRRAAYAARKAA